MANSTMKIKLFTKIIFSLHHVDCPDSKSSTQGRYKSSEIVMKRSNGLLKSLGDFYFLMLFGGLLNITKQSVL